MADIVNANSEMTIAQAIQDEEKYLEEKFSPNILQVLVGKNREWFVQFHQAHRGYPSYESYLVSKSMWLNDFFQKQRILTDPKSKQATKLIEKHQNIIKLKLQRGSKSYEGMESSTQTVEPLALIMYCSTHDRLMDSLMNQFVQEIFSYLNSNQDLIRRANLACLSCSLFRLILRNNHYHSRVLLLQILYQLASENGNAVINGFDIASQGQAILPHIYIQTLPKRHGEHAEEMQLLCNDILLLLPLPMNPFEAQSPSSRLKSTRQVLPPNASPQHVKVHPSPQLIESSKRAKSEHQAKRSPRNLPIQPLQHSPQVKSPIFKAPVPSPYTWTHTKTVLGSSKSDQTLSSNKSVLNKFELFMDNEDSRKQNSLHNRNAGSSTQLYENIDTSTSTGRKILEPLEHISEKLNESFNALQSETKAALETRAKVETDVPLLSGFIEIDNTTIDPMIQGTKSKTNEQIEKLAQQKPMKKKTSKYNWQPEQFESVAGFEWYWRILPKKLELDMKLHDVCEAAIRMHRRTMYPQAIELYMLALTFQEVLNESLIFKLRFNIAMCYLNLNLYAVCINELMRLLSTQPDNPLLHYKLGMVYYKMNDTPSAAREFQSVESYFPLAKSALFAIDIASKSHSIANDLPGEGQNNTDKATSPIISKPTTHNKNHAKQNAAQAIQNVLKMLLVLAQQSEVQISTIFHAIDRNRTGFISIDCFQEALQICNMPLKSSEVKEIIRFCAPLYSKHHLHYTKILKHSVFSGFPDDSTMGLSSDQYCFQGPRKRTKSERTKVQLHQIAHQEAMSFLKYIAIWATFSIDKAIKPLQSDTSEVAEQDPYVVLPAEMLQSLMQPPPCLSTSVVTKLADHFVQENMAITLQIATQLTVLRRGIIKELSVSVMQTVQKKACAYVSKVRKAALKYVSRLFYNHLSQCISVHSDLTQNGICVRNTVCEQKDMALSYLAGVVSHARIVVERKQQAIKFCIDLNAKDRVRRKSKELTSLSKYSPQAQNIICRKTHASQTLADIGKFAATKMETKLKSRMYLLDVRTNALSRNERAHVACNQLRGFAALSLFSIRYGNEILTECVESVAKRKTMI